MNNYKKVGLLFIFSGIAFAVAGYLAGQVAFYGVGGVLAIVGVIFTASKNGPQSSEDKE